MTNPHFYNPNGFKNIWVTADPHIGHKNIVRGISNWDDKSGCRDFDSLEEMDNKILSQINKYVMPQDVLIILGDLSFGGRQNIIRAREGINCRNVAYIFGNHTDKLNEEIDLWKLFVWTGWYNEFFNYGLRFCQFHFPIISWHDMNKGAIMLSGHVHNSLTYKGRQLDCAIETPGRDYKPFHLEEIHDLMTSIPIWTPENDHHRVVEKINV